MIETSVGRIIFNEALPEDFPFQNEYQNGKKMEKVIGKIIEKYGLEESQKTLDRVKNLGFEYATQSGISWGMDDLVVPPEKEGIIKRTEKEVEQIEEHYKKGLL
jgi:DNA-directed RNA polymerase subunit beta'